MPEPCPVCRWPTSPEVGSCPACGADLHARRSRSELRTATLLFADLVGYTQLNEALDPESVAAVMDEIKQGITRLIEAHDGTVNQVVGDQVMAIFGVPSAHDDDPLRAVQAALAIHDFVRELSGRLEREIGHALRFHTSVNTGLVLAQQRDRREGEFVLTGDAVNTGARLAAHSAPGELLVGPETFEAVAPFVDAEPLPPIALRGKHHPIAVHRIRGILVRTRFDAARRRGLSALVGRRAELDLLQEALADLADGQSAWIAVSGEPGVGKSRLLYEIEQLARGAGVAVIAARCEAFGAPTPYAPFAQLLRERLGFADAVSREDRIARAVQALNTLGVAQPQLAALLQVLSLRSDAHPLPQEQHAEALRQAIHESLEAWLHLESQRAPLVVLLEDWHWADTGSELALRHVLRHLDASQILVVASHRPEFEPEWPTAGRRTRLAPLAHSEVDVFIDALLPGSLSGNWRREIHRRTAGNPLFIEEVCRALRESGALQEAPDLTTGASSIPDSVQAVMRARIDRLGPASREVLRIASVLGDDFSLPVLRQLCAGIDLDGCFAELERIGLVHREAEASGRFNHAITRDVAYRMLPRSARPALHDAAGRAIESLLGGGDPLEAPYEELAHHFVSGTNADKALFYLERAGDRAASSFSLAEARSHYRAAVELLARLEPTPERSLRRVDLTFRWSQAGWYGPAPEQIEALEVARRLAAELGERERELRCIYFSGWLCHTTGANARAVDCFESCLRGADANDHRLLAQLYCNLGENLGVGTRHSEALEYLERGLALRMRAFPDRWQTIGMAYALSWMGMVHADRGDFDAYTKHMEQAIGIIAPLSHGSALASINQVRAIAMAIRGDWDGALRYATIGRAVSNAIGAPTNHGMALCIEGFSRFMQSGSGAGVEEIEDGIREMAAAGSQLALSLYLAFLAEVLARSAHPERALEIAGRALARADDGDRLGEVAGHRARALALAAGGAARRDAVEAELATADHLAAAKQSPREQALTDLLRAELCLRWSEREAASRCAARAARALGEMGMAWYRQRAETLAGEALA